MFLNNQTPSPNEGSEKKIEKEAGKRQDNKKEKKRRKGQKEKRAGTGKSPNVKPPNYRKSNPICPIRPMRNQ